MSKRCSKCHTEKEVLDFNRGGRAKDGLQYWCKACIKLYRHTPAGLAAADKYENSIKGQQRRERFDHSVHRKDYDAKRSLDPEVVARRKEYDSSLARREARAAYEKTEQGKANRKRSRSININVRISVKLRQRLNKAIRGQYKAGSAVADLGCPIEEFKQYIESLFQPGMTWENWGKVPGKWQLDHKEPLASFDLTDRTQLLKACHYTNLQPLWYKDNLYKGDKPYVPNLLVI